MRLGDFAEARAESAKIDALGKSGNFAALDAGGVPSKDLLQLMRAVIEGRALMGEHKFAAAAEMYQAAVDLQAKIPYMEPPYFYYPVRQSLGAALVAAGQPARAENEFLHTLMENPNDAYAFWGLAEARRAQGDTDGANAARRFYKRAYAGGRDRPTLAGL